MNLNPTANAIQVRLEEFLDERLVRIFSMYIPASLARCGHASARVYFEAYEERGDPDSPHDARCLQSVYATLTRA